MKLSLIEGEAEAVLAMPKLEQRREYLALVEKSRGTAKTNELVGSEYHECGGGELE